MDEVIGRELYAVKRELMDNERTEHAGRARATYEAQKREQSRLGAFKNFAEPRFRAVLDPTYTKAPEGAEQLTPEEARALKNDLDRRRRHKSASVAKLKAEREFHLNAAADGYLYEVIECELRLDASGTQVRYVVPGSGEVVHHRAATGDERQMALPSDELPDDEPTDGKPKKRKSRKNGAPGVVA